MKTDSLVLEPPPRFTKNGKGKRMNVTLDAASYISLLVRAELTDPNLWPPGTQHGAAALKRIRAIERRCIGKLGYFDWEELSPKLQDEYDGLCADLDRLQDTGEAITLQELLNQECMAAK